MSPIANLEVIRTLGVQEVLDRIRPAGDLLVGDAETG